MNKRNEQTGQGRHTGDYTLYETQPTHSSKGDAKMTKIMKALDAVLQDTNADTLNDTTLFYWDGETFTGTQAEVKTALKETTREKVQAVLTHGADALYATLDGWYDAQVDQEVLGEISTWEEFKALLPDEYELDLRDINAYLHSQETASALDRFYEELIDVDEEKTGGC